MILIKEDYPIKHLSGRCFAQCLLEYLTTHDIIGNAKDIIKNKEGKFERSKESEYLQQFPINDIKADIEDFVKSWLEEVKRIPEVLSVKESSSPYFGFSQYIHVKLKKPDNKDLNNFYKQHKGQYTNVHFKFTDHIQKHTPYKDSVGMIIRDQVDYSNKSFEDAATEMMDKIYSYIEKLHRRENEYLSNANA